MVSSLFGVVLDSATGLDGVVDLFAFVVTTAVVGICGGGGVTKHEMKNGSNQIQV